MLLLALLHAGCGKPAADQENLFLRYSGYRDIPGVTDEEIRNIEALKARGTHFIYGANPSTEAFLEENGDYGGYSCLWAERLSELFGIPFTVGIYEWGELLKGLENLSIDFSGDLTATPERRKLLFMTGTIAERPIKIFRISGTEPMDRISRERPLNFCFLEGSTTLDAVKPYIAGVYHCIFVDEYENAYELLKTGETDAFFEEGIAEAAFDVYEDVIADDFFPLVYSQVSLSTGNPALSSVISVVDKYLEHGGIRELADFYNQGYQEYLRHKFFAQLSDKERRFLMETLARGAEIPICTEFDSYPASFWNEQEQEWQGIAIDVLKEIEKLTGLRFVPQNNTDDEWSVLMKMLESGRAMLVTELLRSEDRKGRFLWPDMPYTEDNYALISTLEFPDISVNQVLYRRVGLITDTAYAHIFNEWFPGYAETSEYDDNFTAVDALEKGEIDLLMANHNLLLWITNYLEKPGFKANIVFNHPCESFFGFYIKAEELCSLVSKAQKLVDTTTITSRWTRRFFDYRGKMARAQVPWLIGSLALLAAVLVLFAIMLIHKRREGKWLERVIHQRTRDLEEQTEAAQVASRAKGEFLAHMSHEIRTPLNAIIGMTAIARKNAESEKTKSSLEEIHTASNHLLDILNDILDMSKIEAGKFALIHEPFAMLEALEEVSEIISMRCREKQLTFVPSYDDIPDVTVLGDKLRLKQVLINLLGNSVKFTNEKGRVELRCKKNSVSDKEMFFTFTVIDSGIGMSEDQLRKLFTPFEQTESSISVRFGGTGLGLVISQNLINQMGGQITVKSKPKEGSVFTFTIGLEPTEPVKTETEIPDDFVPELRGRRILLAEDIEINRMIVTELLSDTHAEIEEAVDGQEAVDKFSASEPGHFDFIFMDVQMPNLNGYDASRRIREIEQQRFSQAGPGQQIPIYAMTANAYREDIDRALEAGMNGHVAKPVDIKMVMKILGEHFLMSNE